MSKYRVSARMVRDLWSDHSIRLEDAARQLGLSRQTFCNIAKGLGLPARPRGSGYAFQRKGDDSKFRELWLAGVSVRDIRAHFGYAHRQAVEVRRRSLGLPSRLQMGKSSAVKRGAPISLAEFKAVQAAKALAARLDVEASQTRNAFILSEMVDRTDQRPLRLA